MADVTALRAHGRGGPEVLIVERAPIPEPAPAEVLIEVHAAAITFDRDGAAAEYVTVPAACSAARPTTLSAPPPPGKAETAEVDAAGCKSRLPTLFPCRTVAPHTRAAVGPTAARARPS